MTQYNQRPYPDPNQPPMQGYAQADPYAAQGWGATLKTCRAAAIAQIAMGALIGLMAFCVIAAGMMAVAGAIPADEQGEFAELSTQFGDAAGVIFVVTGICVGVPGLAQLILGFFVWRGSKAGIIVSMVVDGLFGVLMLLNLAAMLAGGELHHPAGMCVNVFMLAAVAGLFALLVMAYRESSAASAAKAAYEAQWQQYYQQQYQAAMYQQMAGAQPPAPSHPPQPSVVADAPVDRSAELPPPPAPAIPEPPREDQPGSNPPPSAPPAF